MVNKPIPGSDIKETEQTPFCLANLSLLRASCSDLAFYLTQRTDSLLGCLPLQKPVVVPGRKGEVYSKDSLTNPKPFVSNPVENRKYSLIFTYLDDNILSYANS